MKILCACSLFLSVHAWAPQQQQLSHHWTWRHTSATLQPGKASFFTQSRGRSSRQIISQLQAATTSTSDLSSLSDALNTENDGPTFASSASDAVITAAESSTKKSYLDDGFVFGLEGSGLQRPKGKVPVVVVEGDSLETQPYQVAIVSATFAAHSYFFYTSFLQMLSINQGNAVMTSLQALLLVLSSWVLADFGSGVLHWSVDNYGNGRTPIFGSLIAGFQGHHTAPWTITERGFCNNVYKLCLPFGIVPMALINFLAGPFTTFFFTSFCVMEIMSQEFHKWSHMTKSQCPKWVNWLQDIGVSVGRVPHAQHHLAPFHGNYCIISGLCNNVLDESGLFRRMERVIYQWNGVESNAWKLDPSLRERTLQGDYSVR